MSIANVVLLAAMTLPLGDSANWQILQYNKIPPNEVIFSDEGLTLRVNQSASPVIYPLPESQQVSAVKVKGTLSDVIAFSDGQTQGEKRVDDFTLRVGLVIKGDKELNWFQRKVAADWILTLYSLAPDGTGIDHILFLNATQQQALLDTEREHPLSDLIKEKFVWQLDEAGSFSFETSLTKPEEVVAIWISSDGDDTGAKYQITFNEIILD